MDRDESMASSVESAEGSPSVEAKKEQQRQNSEKHRTQAKEFDDMFEVRFQRCGKFVPSHSCFMNECKSR